VHVFRSYDWFERGVAFRVLSADERQSIGVARLIPRITAEPGSVAGSAPAILRQVAGDVPSRILMGEDGETCLRAGWHALEGAGSDAFRWTEGECRFLLAVEGQRICFEVAADRPSGAVPVVAQLLSLDREIGSMRIAADGAWHVVAVRLPEGFPHGPAHLRLVIRDPWRPVDVGYGDDGRVLGVRVRGIWCE
jgi:hypothetical protein